MPYYLHLHTAVPDARMLATKVDLQCAVAVHAQSEEFQNTALGDMLGHRIRPTTPEEEPTSSQQPAAAALGLSQQNQ